MSTIVTRAGKGSALSWTEADANFINLNTDKAELASPTFTGTPAAPTAAVGTNTTQVATTAYTKAEIASDRPYSDTNPIMDSTAAQGTSPKVSRQDHVHPSDTTKADLSGATFTGAVSAAYGLTVKAAATGSNDGNVVSGTYTPTFSNYTNVSSSSVNGVWSYMRIGNVVSVSGQLAVTPTSSGVFTSFLITLPVASALSSSNQVSGHVNARNSGGRVVGDVVGDASGDRAWASYIQVANTNLMDVVVSFMYQVI